MGEHTSGPSTTPRMGIPSRRPVPPAIHPAVYRHFADALGYLATEAQRLNLTELTLFIEAAKQIAVDHCHRQQPDSRK